MKVTFSSMLRERCGMTRIELLVIGLLALIIAGFAFCWTTRVRESVLVAQTNNNLKRTTFACHWCNDLRRKLPPAFDGFGEMRTAASVHVHLLPFVEEERIYSAFVHSQPDAKWATVAAYIFESPRDPTLKKKNGVQNFAANLRVFSDAGYKAPYNADMPALTAIEPGDALLPASFTDGTSNTILFATKFAVCGEGGSHFAAAPNSTFAAFFGEQAAKIAAQPSEPGAEFHAWATFQLDATNCHPTPLMPQAFTKAGLSVALADGSVRTASPKVSPETWNRAVQPNDGLPPGSDWD